MNELQTLVSYIYDMARKAPATAEDHAKAFNVYQRLLQAVADNTAMPEQSGISETKPD
jgi:hypothetical protein